MARISGVDLNNEKKIDIALTKLYGIGRSNVVPLLKSAGIASSKRAKDLSEEEINKLQKVVDGFKVEGDLRREVADNIKRLKEIAAYRGLRHSRNLPVRGQRTRSNARTKRGKRVTIGAIKKEMATKMGLDTKQPEK
ncbi:30S ribosomal protein S13 [Candidatus Microgenomates bacterium]|nr:30S ribosomal protein S13 [Candidatus Microgenomates bacterium]